jgi:hypothetical protein
MAALTLRARVLPLSTRSALGLLTVGGAIGGAVTGSLLGSAGALSGLPQHRAAVVAVVATAVVVATLRAPRRQYGINRQVGRRLGSTGKVWSYFFVCGVQLGTGVATLVPYSAFLVLVAGLLVAGPVGGLIAGTVYGTLRLALSADVLRGADIEDPGRAMDVFSARGALAARANLILVATAAAVGWIAAVFGS